jgi:hypothetical protein
MVVQQRLRGCYSAKSGSCPAPRSEHQIKEIEISPSGDIEIDSPNFDITFNSRENNLSKL